MANKLRDEDLTLNLIVNGNKAKKELGETEKSTRELISKNKALIAEMAKLEAAGKKGSAEWKSYEQQLKSNGKTIIDNENKMAGLRKEIGVNNLSVVQLRKEYRSLKGQMDNLDPNDPKWKGLNSRLIQVKGRLSEVGGGAARMQTAFGNMWKRLLPAIGIATVIAGLTRLVSKIVDIRKEFEKYEAVLTNSLGSNKKARMEMQMLQKFAAETPFALTELTAAFVKLTNYGLKPNREELRKYGDLASSVGKGIDQLVEGVADAVTREFERLKEFGIKAKKEGDKISFTFKEQTTVVENNAQAIKGYIMGLGDLQGVSGSMAAIAGTLGGKISNMGDAWDGLMNTMGAGSSGVMVTVITWMTSFIGMLDGSFKSISQIKEAVKDQAIVDATNGHIVNIDAIAKRLVKNGMEQTEAAKRAKELFFKQLDEQIKGAKKMAYSLDEIDRKKGYKKLDQLNEEKQSLIAHFKNMSDIQQRQKEAADAKAKSLNETELEKSEKERLAAAKKASEALAAFFEKDSEKQQDAINKYFHDAGEGAFDAFIKAIEDKQKGGMDLSLIPAFKPEEEKKDAGTDYAITKFKETQAWLEIQYTAGIISEQEYQDKLTEINKKAEEDRFKVKEQKLKQAQQLVEFGANFVVAMMDFELEKAGDNEEKKAEIKRKYANAQFLAATAGIVVNTALSIMRGFAELGPIGGAIAAILLGATGLVQIGIANAQKQKMLGSKKEGGYTGQASSDNQPMGVYHANEWFANAKAVRNPEVKQFLDVFDYYQRTGQISKLNTKMILANLPVQQMYAGGYSSGSSTSPAALNAPATIPNSGAGPSEAAIIKMNALLQKLDRWNPSIAIETYERKRDNWKKTTSGGLKG